MDPHGLRVNIERPAALVLVCQSKGLRLGPDAQRNPPQMPDAPEALLAAADGGPVHPAPWEVKRLNTADTLSNLVRNASCFPTSVATFPSAFLTTVYTWVVLLEICEIQGPRPRAYDSIFESMVAAKVR